MARLKLVLAHYDDDGLSEDECEHELARWHEHLATLTLHDRDAAEYAMSGYVMVLDGCVRCEGEP